MSKKMKPWWSPAIDYPMRRRGPLRRKSVDLISAGPSSFVPLAQALEQPRRTSGAHSRKIYVLTGPDRRVVYVGVTRHSLKVRLESHIKEPTSERMAGWFRELRCGRSQPQAHLLEVVSEGEWEDAERGWIHWFRERGTLLNVDRGGQARDRTGKLRRFMPGEYQPPMANAPTTRAPNFFAKAGVKAQAPKVLQDPIKAPVVERLGEAVFVRRPSRESCGGALQSRR